MVVGTCSGGRMWWAVGDGEVVGTNMDAVLLVEDGMQCVLRGGHWWASLRGTWMGGH